MSDTSNIGEGSSSIQPSESSGTGGVSGEPSEGSIQDALHARVKTLGQLKQVLVAHLGEKEGTKLYNSFLRSFAMQMLGQLQQADQQAKQAAKNMRTDTPT